MRTLIVDDHQLFSAGLRLLLSTTEGVGEVDCAGSGAEALQRAAATAYDLVLLDWHLGREPSGEALIAQLREVLPQARVVVVSGEAKLDIVRSAIDAGAVGFVPKDAAPEALIQALGTVARGGVCLPDDALAADAAWLPDDPSAEGESASGGLGSRGAGRSGIGAALTEIGAAFPQLTPRHVAVLGHIVRGLSNKEIGRDLGIADGTVKQHANAIYRELGLQNRTEAVYMLAKMGVRFR